MVEKLEHPRLRDKSDTFLITIPYLHRKYRTQEYIEKALYRYSKELGRIQRWVWTYREDEPERFEIAIECFCNVAAENVTRWFEVKSEHISLPCGNWRFLDAAESLLYEKVNIRKVDGYLYSDLGKAVYAPDDDRVNANFDLAYALEKKYALRREVRDGDEDKYGTSDPTLILRLKVLKEGLTIEEITNSNPLAYANDYEALDRMREEYLKTHKGE